MELIKQTYKNRAKIVTAALLLAYSLLIPSLHAQVTIGSNIAPTRAALLDLKTQQADVTTNATTTQGGLLLPRVELVSISTLEPFVGLTDEEWTDPTKKATLTKSLTGLMVYNITNNGTGSTLYPAVYTWNGATWATSQANEAVSSITGQPKPFTFYELGTGTAVPLTFVVDGLGTWTYQWYQVTGSNVHVRIGTPIGGSGTISGTGATSASFIPTGVLKGTTRNANNTGFYKFYCIAKSSLGAELTSDIAEVAVGCGAKNNAGEWISFMCFNLGATDLTIDAQINHTMVFNPVNDSDGKHYYIANEENLYGDLYQWGRIGDGHEKRGVSAGFTVGQNTAGTNQVAYNTTTPPTYEDGNLIGTIQRYPQRQVARTDATYYGKFITTGFAQNYNWAFNLSADQIDQLWRTGRFAANDPCAKIKEDGLTYETYYPVTDGTSGANTAWRTPSQDEWGSIYKGGTVSGSPGVATANTWTWNSANSRGYEIKPDGVTTTLFLPASGYRNDGNGLLYNQGTTGNYWSIGSLSTSAYNLDFLSGSINPATSNYRGNGFALRCIKNQ